MVRILHVTESMGSGVEAAILDYVRSSPADMEHSLLFASRGYRTGGLHSAGFRTVTNAGVGAGALARKYRSALRDERPDVVHFHSSWAGLVGRSLTNSKRTAVVYSPHSFYFDRTDLSPLARFVARGAEKILSKRTHVIAAVSPYERECARSLGAESVYVPHVAPVFLNDEKAPTTGPATSGGARIATVGRLSAQKDPCFLIDVKRCLDARGVEADWLWIGGGDASYQQRLEDAGVQVTGWLERAEALQLVRGSSVYLHTASWEGNPISLLEVEQMGVPAVVRSIPSVVSLGYPANLGDAESIATELERRLDGFPGSFSPELPGVGEQIAAQRRALGEVYGEALSRIASS